MASWNKVIAGNTLYGVRSSLAIWPVKVINMDSVTETAIIEWNHNKPRQVTRKQLESYRVNRPAAKSVAK